MLPVGEVGELEAVAGGVEVAAHLVADAAEADVVEEGPGRVLAAAAVGGEAVVVEAVVGGLRELAVADELAAEHVVDGVQQTLPVVAAMDLPPPCGQFPVIVRMPRRLRCLIRAAARLPDHRGRPVGCGRRGDDDIAARTTTALNRVRQCRIGEAPVVHGGQEAQAGRYGGCHHRLLGVVTDSTLSSTRSEIRRRRYACFERQRGLASRAVVRAVATVFLLSWRV